MSDWAPTANWQALKLRASILRRMREFLDRQGFIEVETPLLSSDTVIDRHIDPIPVAAPMGSTTTNIEPSMWLQTSPEFAMKRLMAAGGEAIYQVTHAFRASERGALHNPEFTIAEWYRLGDDMQAGMKLLADLCQHVLQRDPVEPVTYRQAFLKHVGIDPHEATNDELAAIARKRSVSMPNGFLTDKENEKGSGAAHRDAWLDLLLSECVAPRLGQQAPTILHDYPASQAMLSRVRHDDPPVAERFELFVDGVELANGYHELLDAEELLRRNQEANRLRQREGKQPLDEETRLIDAMRAGMPPCSGCALGVDRLVMIAAGATSIDDVLTFPIERA